MPFISDLGDIDLLQKQQLHKFLEQLCKKADHSPDSMHGLLVLCLFSGPSAVQTFLKSYPDWLEHSYRSKYQAQVLQQLLQERPQQQSILTSWVADNLQKYDQQAHEILVLLDDESPNVNVMASMDVQAAIALHGHKSRDDFKVMMKGGTVKALQELLGTLPHVEDIQRFSFDQFKEFHKALFLMTPVNIAELGKHLRRRVLEKRESLQAAFESFSTAVTVPDVTDSLLDVLKHTHSAVVKADLRWQTTLSMYKFDTFRDEILSLKRRFESILGKEFKKLQMVTAFLAINKLRAGRSVIAQVPGGFGKSLIAAFAAGLAAQTETFKEVLMVYPNKYLMERDCSASHRAMHLMGADRVRYLNIDQLKRDIRQVKSQTALIFDEADVMLYEHSVLLASLTQAKAKMLLLTATLGTSPFEQDFLKSTGILVMKPYKIWN